MNLEVHKREQDEDSIPQPKMVKCLKGHAITPQTVLQSHELRLNELEDVIEKQGNVVHTTLYDELKERDNDLEKILIEQDDKLNEIKDMVLKLQAFMIETNMMVTDAKKQEEFAAEQVQAEGHRQMSDKENVDDTEIKLSEKELFKKMMGDMDDNPLAALFGGKGKGKKNTESTNDSPMAALFGGEDSNNPLAALFGGMGGLDTSSTGSLFGGLGADTNEKEYNLNLNIGSDEEISLDICDVVGDSDLPELFLKKTEHDAINDNPVSEAPVSEAPVSEAPVSEAPVSEAPVSEAPVSEAPVSEALIEEQQAHIIDTQQIQNKRIGRGRGRGRGNK